MLSAGRLRHRVGHARPVTMPTGKGGFTVTTDVIAPAIPAEVIEIAGSEAVKDKVIRGVRFFQVTMRWRPDVRQSDQLLYDGETLNIRSAIDRKARRQELVILADTEAMPS